ncbi:DinB family protein [Paenibacillus antarcticus]|uniref:Damage-inducible protein DinB n=1 Tax=Paenibacillus antarcticus TaxID=253703 RepID=A0A168NFI3_9BACL|nr:DinB family protein [Paenibacillus antarcticus]OAB45744.1 damage-inducible protein DinB [Paenibacillus antarcticus]
MTSPTIKMYDYHVWANGVIMNRIKELPQEIYHKEVQSGFSSISKVMTHIYLVDSGWFDIISGKSMNEAFAYANAVREQLEANNIEEMETLLLNLSERYKVFINLQEDLDREIVVDNPYAGLLETSPSESILHVVTHGSYHRGNVATMLRQLGHTSVMQDYGLYLYSQ